MALSGVRQEHLYLCVQEMHKEGYAITEICDILELNRSSYYNWTHRVKSNREAEKLFCFFICLLDRERFKTDMPIHFCTKSQTFSVLVIRAGKGGGY